MDETGTDEMAPPLDSTGSFSVILGGVALIGPGGAASIVVDGMCSDGEATGPMAGGATGSNSEKEGPLGRTKISVPRSPFRDDSSGAARNAAANSLIL